MRARGERGQREKDGGVFGHVGLLSDHLYARQRKEARRGTCRREAQEGAETRLHTVKLISVDRDVRLEAFDLWRRAARYPCELSCASCWQIGIGGNVQEVRLDKSLKIAR